VGSSNNDHDANNINIIIINTQNNVNSAVIMTQAYSLRQFT